MVMKFRNISATFILSLLFSLSLLAQPQEWGKITDEELLMEGIEEDPDADAVILFNTCRIQFTPRFELETFYHKRIKILTEAGKEYANIEIYCGDEDKIYKLDAVCYTTDGKKHELDEDNVFDEETENWKRKKFSIPGVEIGSVIEYKYQTWSKYFGRLEPWAFQEKDYTKYSEIMVYLPYGFTYTVIPFNLAYDQFERRDEILRDPYNRNKDCPTFKWIVKDMPGIKKEPYMTAFSDYITKILFQVESYKSVYQHIIYTETWNNLAEDLWDGYKGKIGQDGGIEDFTKNFVKGVNDPLSKIEKIYDYARWEIRTIGQNELWGKYIEDPKNVFKSKEGSTNDKNILLINMLKYAGIEAQPLLISTRNHGAINPGWVSIQQFNRIIAHIKLDKKSLYLNCGEKYCPMGYLTPEYNVELGFLIDENKGRIIKLNPKSSENRFNINTVADLIENGQITVHSQIEYQGMNGIMERDRIDGKDLDEYLSGKIEKLNSEAVLDSFNYSDVDSLKEPLVLDLYYHIPGFLEEMDSLSFFTVPLLTGESKNIFVREKRSFPVDFDYETTLSEKVEIHLADCYQLSELPERLSTYMSSLFFSKIYFTSENTIECNRSFKLKRTRFPVIEYIKLRQVYDIMVNSDQDQIVVTRK